VVLVMAVGVGPDGGTNGGMGDEAVGWPVFLSAVPGAWSWWWLQEGVYQRAGDL
jgi:hypothetical protein